jgi:hypothetical protein
MNLLVAVRDRLSDAVAAEVARNRRGTGRGSRRTNPPPS